MLHRAHGHWWFLRPRYVDGIPELHLYFRAIPTNVVNKRAVEGLHMLKIHHMRAGSYTSFLEKWMSVCDMESTPGRRFVSCKPREKGGG